MGVCVYTHFPKRGHSEVDIAWLGLIYLATAHRVRPQHMAFLKIINK